MHRNAKNLINAVEFNRMRTYRNTICRNSVKTVAKLYLSMQAEVHKLGGNSLTIFYLYILPVTY